MNAAGVLAAPIAAVPPVPGGEAWTQVGELGLALLLSALIGLEREFRQKSAGLRTYTLVGVGAALFMLVSKYGFGDIILQGRVVLDPSRVAAQIVSGVGFLGAGLIFVQRGSVRGLTTAAAVWVVAAVGAAAAAGLPILASLTTAIYFLVTLGFPFLSRRLPRSASAISPIHVRYPDGKGILRQVLALATDRGFVIDDVETETSPSGDRRMIEVTLHVHGRQSVDDLAAALTELPKVEAVLATDANAAED